MRTRNKKGQYARKRYTSLIVVLMFISYVAGAYGALQGRIAPVLNTVFAKSINEEQKADIIHNYFLDQLAECESGGDPTIVILDTNSANSRGEFMFQTATMTYYLDKFGMLGDMEQEDVINYSHSSELSREMASRIIKTEYYDDWYICSRKTGIDWYVDRTEIIK